MDETQKHFRLGLFVVITIFLLFGVLFILGGQSLFKSKVTFETYFDNSVSGLDVGSPVLYRGIALGKVVSIELSNSVYEAEKNAEMRKSYVIVRSEVIGDKKAIQDWKKNLDTSIKLGLRAQTQLAGITGQQYLSLDYSSDNVASEDLSYEWKPKFLYIPSSKSSTGKIIAGVQTLLSNLDDVDIVGISKNVDQLIVTLNEKAQAIDTAQMSTTAVSLLNTTNQMVSDIDTLLANSKLDDTLNNLNSATASANNLLADPEIKQMIASLASITTVINQSVSSGGDINQLITDLGQAVARTDTLIADNQYDITSMIRDLKLTAANLKELSDTAKRNPSGIVFGSAPEEVNFEDKK